MLAVSCFFSHATAGRTIQIMHLLKVSCFVFARLRPSCALDPHVSDRVFITNVASHTLLNRSIKYKQYFSNAVQIVIQTPKWAPRLAKLVSIPINAVSSSITFTLTPRHPISSTGLGPDFSSLAFQITSYCCILFIASLQWPDRRKNI